MKRRLLIALGVLAAAGGMYALKNVPSRPDASPFMARALPDTWGTYRSEDFGFEVRYPERYAYDDAIALKHGEEEFAVFFYSDDQRDAAQGKFVGAPKFTVLKARKAPELSLAGWIGGKLPIAGARAEDVAFGDNRFTRVAQAGAIAFYTHLLAGDDAMFVVSTPQYDAQAPGVYREILSNFRVF